MEGVLLKWTNYFSDTPWGSSVAHGTARNLVVLAEMKGWQPRWFVLDNGVLSYYKSQEDVNNGCKGSIKMAVCDIMVHPSDGQRMDLVIPGEQHYCVRASTPQERQAWLVALGSAKASFHNGQAPQELVAVPRDTVRSKKSELRLYCDLLMQQVLSVKQAATAESGPDVEKLNEASSLLSATCDTFIHTLEDCMTLMKAMAVQDAAPKGPKQISRSNSIDRYPSPSPPYSLGNSGSRPGQRQRTGSESSHQEMPPETNGVAVPRGGRGGDSHSDSELPSQRSSPRDQPHPPTTLHPPPPLASSRSPPSPLSPSMQSIAEVRLTSSSAGSSEASPTEHSTRSEEADSTGTEDFKDAIDTRPATFFSTLTISFTSIPLEREDEIVVQPFLEACRCILPIFDKLNSTAFAPVKMDFSGNIRKIQQKYSTSPNEFRTLQSMIVYEVKHGQHLNSSSATVATIWLKRGLEFIREFLREVCSGQMDMTQCASNAYSRTLKPFHGWVVRGVFAVAAKALPYREVFVRQLNESPDIDPASSSFEHALMADIEVFLGGLQRITTTMDNFYVAQGLQFMEQG